MSDQSEKKSSKNKFKTLNINKLYCDKAKKCLDSEHPRNGAEAESLKLTSDITTVRRPPAGLPSLKAESRKTSYSDIVGLKEDGTDSTSDSDDNQDSTPERLSPVDNPPLEEHKLQYPYWLWYRHTQEQNNTLQNYEQSLMLVGQCSTVEQWWGLYSHLKRTDELPPDTSFHLFKVGIRPMWEDSANINGGKWEVRIRRGLGSWAWEEICLALLGEQFDMGDEICGAVVNIKVHEVLVAVWHRTASDQVASRSIQDTIRQVLNLPPWIFLEYKRHSKSLRAATFTSNTSNSDQNSTS